MMTIMKGAMTTMRIKNWNIEAITGYKPKTTWYQDFSIADVFGASAVVDTFKDAMMNCENLGCEYLTELVMVLNWKIFEHYEKNDVLANLYNELWEAASEHALETLQGEELDYYLNTTD